MNENIITLSDSYKYSQSTQYPENMVKMFDYAEARSNKVYPATIFFGLQYIIEKYLTTPITLVDIFEAEGFALAHGEPFNRDGWIHILKKHDGYLPVKIRAVQEGLLIPTQNVLFTIESTDEEVPWIVGFLETLLLKVWYTSNIATRSYYVKELIRKYWEKSVNEDTQVGIDFAYHNFGDRGSSSVESAGIGGVAHLTQFKGTDNFNSLKYARRYYGADIAGFSIPASEHSTVTSWGKDNEFDFYDSHLENFKDKVMIACVMDSYDYLKAVDYITKGEFKEKVESDEYPKFIIRPDSGDPVDMISKTLEIMEMNKVKITINTKGYKEFDKYGILWGDGIDDTVMEKILELLKKRKYAASVVAFGSGGWLMQAHDRDSQGWAVKCSSITVDEGGPLDDGTNVGVWEPFLVNRDVFKDPITAKSKKSKKGRITLWYNHDSKEYFTDNVDFKTNDFPVTDMLNTVYENGKVNLTWTLEQVREANKG